MDENATIYRYFCHECDRVFYRPDPGWPVCGDCGDTLIERTQPNWAVYGGRPCFHGFYSNEACDQRGCVRYIPSSPPREEKRPIMGALRLWRYWSVPLDSGVVLRSTASSYGWQVDAQRSHLPPRRGLEHCGFHGYSNVRECVSHATNFLGGWGIVMGSFLAWGRVVRHTYGYRVEWAQVEMLTMASGTVYDVNNQPLGTSVHKLAERYDVPIVNPMGYDRGLSRTAEIVPFDEFSIRQPDEILRRELYGG